MFYGTFLTPRAHVKWVMNDVVTLRLSAGKGYRSPHVLAESKALANGRAAQHLQRRIARGLSPHSLLPPKSPKRPRGHIPLIRIYYTICSKKSKSESMLPNALPLKGAGIPVSRRF